MLRRVALVTTDVTGEHMARVIRVTIIAELGTTLAVTSNRRALHRNKMIEALSSSETSYLQEPHGVTSQKTAFLKVTAVKTSNLTWY
jgi:hypothetical protein